MAQKSFGRRHLPSQTDAMRPDPSTPASDAGQSRSEGSGTRGRTTVVISSALASILALGALGFGLAPNVETHVNDHASGAGVEKRVPTGLECSGRAAACTNQYSVELSCGENDEPKTITVVAANAEAAGSTAERYNRGCRARRASFVAALVRNATHNVSRSLTRSADTDRPSRRRGWRLRRR